MMCEQTGPKQPERDVALAEQAGFDFAVISDHALRHPFGIVWRLQQERGDRGDQHAPGHPGRAAGAQIPGDLAGSHRVPDQYGLAQVEVLQALSVRSPPPGTVLATGPTSWHAAIGHEQILRACLVVSFRALFLSGTSRDVRRADT